MLIRPNKTRLLGRIASITRQGQGADVEIDVARNDSVPDDDFLRPAPGTRLKLYSSEPEQLTLGLEVLAEARLDGGPFGQRAILESIQPTPFH